MLLYTDEVLSFGLFYKEIVETSVIPVGYQLSLPVY